jgi:hypothetical protein
MLIYWVWDFRIFNNSSPAISESSVRTMRSGLPP